MNDPIYPVIAGFYIRGNKAEPPAFPDSCPICGAERTDDPDLPITGQMWRETETGRKPNRRWATYECGGFYAEMVQIQNHTDRFGGRCRKPETVRIGRAFYDDHEARDLPTPTAIRENSRSVWIFTTDPAYEELISDARYYASDPGAFDDPRFSRAAQRMLDAIERQQEERALASLEAE